MLIAKQLLDEQRTGAFGQPVTVLRRPGDNGPSNLKWPCKQCKKPNQVSVRHHMNGIACATCRSTSRYEQRVANAPKEPNMLGLGKAVGPHSEWSVYGGKKGVCGTCGTRENLRQCNGCSSTRCPKHMQQHYESETGGFGKSKFSRLSGKIQRREGYSKDTADKIAAAAGRRSIGAHAMAVRAARSRRRNMGKATEEHAFQNNRTPDGGKFKPECSCGWSGRPCHTMFGSAAQHSNHVRDIGGMQKSVKPRPLTIPEYHAVRIARDTLRMPDEMVGVMGGPSKDEARETLRRHGRYDESIEKGITTGSNRPGLNGRPITWPCKGCGKQTSPSQHASGNGRCQDCAAVKSPVRVA